MVKLRFIMDCARSSDSTRKGQEFFFVEKRILKVVT
jgi:hypothetical protein